MRKIINSKKKVSFIVAGMMNVMLLMGCGSTEVNNNIMQNDEAQERLSIVTTTFAPYDFAREVVGEYGDITMLVPPAAESHSYEPTPQDIIKIQNCDVFIYGGGESDDWVTEVLGAVGNEKIKVVKMLELVDTVEEEIVEGMQAEAHEHDEVHENETVGQEIHESDKAEIQQDNQDEKAKHQDEEVEYDEHVWTSPKNAIQIVKGIEEAVSEVDTGHEAVFSQNATSYIDELETLDQQFEEVVASAKRKEVIFADRFPLRYFVEAYGLKYYAAFPGCSTETEPSAATVAFLIDKVKEDKIPVVFHIEMSNEKMADTICEATGAKKLLFNACHTVSKTDFESGVTYIDIMKNNVEVLKEALN